MKEVKTVSGSPEAREVVREMMVAFEAFKGANDERLMEVEKKAAADALLEEKVARIDQALTGAQAKLDRMMAQETSAFVSGNGVNKPKGFLAYDTVANSAHEWGKIGYVASGAAGDFAASDPADKLIDLIYGGAQFQGCGLLLCVAAGAATRRNGEPDGLSGDGNLGDAGCGGGFVVDCVWWLPALLSDCGSCGGEGVA